VDGTAVYVLYRDLDAVEQRLREAEAGRFEVPNQAGYVVGAPTYLLVGELAVCQVLRGDLPRPTFPDALRVSAPRWWLGRAVFSLLLAEGYAAEGDSVCCAGMLVEAVLAAAHARLAQRGEWVLNEKQLVERAGLAGAGSVLGSPGCSPDELAASVAQVRKLVGLEPPIGPKRDQIIPGGGAG
jgi:hypothetical protein